MLAVEVLSLDELLSPAACVISTFAKDAGNTHARYGAEGESVFAEIGSTWPVVGWSLANTSGSDFITRELE